MHHAILTDAGWPSWGCANNILETAAEESQQNTSAYLFRLFFAKSVWVAHAHRYKQPCEAISQPAWFAGMLNKQR